MAVTLEELQIKFTAQMGSLTSQLNGVKTQINGITSSVKGTSTAFAGMARAAKLFIGAFVIRGMVKIGKASLEMANDVVESESLFAVSMKGMADEARKWSDDLSDSLGLNAYNLRRNVGTFNTMFMSMGLGEKAAYDMSTSLVQLAEDMASFYNVDPEEMFTKLRAGITGETEPLKRLGIMVDEQTVKQYALSEGISTTGKELTQTEKLMARYAAIMGQTADAQGDLARTINSPVNQIRVLNNQLDMAKIALGQAFMPIQAVVLPILTALANAATTAAQALAYLMGALGGFGGVGIFANSVAASGAEVNQDLADSLKDSAKAYKKAGGAAKQASKDAKVGLKAFDEINKLTEETTKTGGGAGGGIDEIDVPDIEPASDYADALQVISDKVRNVAAAIKEFWDKLKNSALGMMVEGAFGALKWLWTDVIKPFGEWAIANPDVIGNVLGGIAVGLATWEVGKMITGGLGATKLGEGLLKLGAAISAHPTLAVVSVAAAGITMLLGAINNNFQESKMRDLADRFGDISIGMEDLKIMAEQTRTPFVNAIMNLRSEYAAIEASANKVRELASKAGSMAMAFSLMPEPLTKEQKALLESQIQSMIDLTFATLNQAKAFSAGAISLTFGEDGKELIKIDAENWTVIEGELKRLGEELDKAVADYMLTDDPTAEQAAAVVEYQTKLANLLYEATNMDAAMAEVRLHRLKTDFSGAVLTPDTVKNYSQALKDELATQESEVNKYFDGMMALQIKQTRIAGEIKGLPKNVIEANVAAITEEWDKQRNIELKEIRLTVGGAYAIGVSGQISKAFGKELQNAKRDVDILSRDFAQEALDFLFKTGMTQAEIDTNEGQMAIGLIAEELYREAMKSIDMPTAEARANAREMLEIMRPTIDEWRVLEADLILNGERVPEWLLEGLRDAETLELIANEPERWQSMIQNGVDGIYISPENMSEQGKAALNSIITEFNRGAIDIGTAASRISDVIELEAYISATPWTEQGKKVVAGILRELANGKISVQEAAERLAQAAKDGLSNVSLYNSGANMGQGYANGIDSKIESVKAAARRLANAATGTLKVTQMEKSPSKITKESGRYFGEGFVIGIGDMADQVYSASERLAQDAVAGLNSTAMSANSTLTVEEGGVASVISNGIEQGIQRVMNALNINLNVDGQTFGTASIRAINDAQRNAGRLLLEM